MPVNFNTDINGYVANYNITKSGSYGLVVVVTEAQILSSPILVSPAPLNVANCNTSGDISGTFLSFIDILHII